MSEALADRWIVVLGAAVRADGSPSAALLRRLERAVAEFEGEPQRTVLMPTGGVGRVGPAEAAVMARWFESRGVPKSCIRPVPVGRNTRLSLAACLRELPPPRVRPSIFVCSDGYHLPRCRMILRLWGRPSEGVPCHRPGRVAWMRAVAREGPAIVKDLCVSVIQGPG